MAVNPNTDFVSGAILTAAQQNRFPRGVMAYAQTTTTDATITTEEVQVTSPSFTPVANRYYRITYYEPQISPAASAGAFIVGRIRLTGTGGTGYQTAIVQNPTAGSFNQHMKCEVVTTLAAVSTVIVATLAATGGTGNATRVGTNPSSVAYLCIEDIGPA